MEPFKTYLSADVAAQIADHLQPHVPGFSRDAFLRPLVAALEPLEMKDRARAMAAALIEVLPTEPAARADVLQAMLHPDLTGPGISDANGLRGWAVWPLTMVIAEQGLDDFDRSLAVLRQMTMRFTSEFAVRPFLIADQSRCLSILSDWRDDPNEHVRRWISEGTRPRLPWGERLHQLVADPSPMLPLLTALRDDPSAYVRRSVANHLNDIAKDHPKLVADLAQDWWAGAPANRRGVVKHALRGLVKAGDPAALSVLGLNPPQIEAAAPVLAADTIKLGEALEISCQIRSTSDRAQSLSVDLVIWFLKADGSQKPKVFKGGLLDLAAHASATFTKRLPLRAVTTRKHYAGGQTIALRINGQDTAQTPFTLTL